MAELPVGRAAKGKAGVFGSSINPLAVYMQYAGQRQRNKAALEQQYKASRDKYLEDQNKWNPKGAWEDMYEPVSQLVTSGRNRTIDLIERNGGVVDSRIKKDANEWQGYVDEVANKTMALKKIYESAYKEIDENPIMDKQYAKSKLNDRKDQWKGALMNGTSIDDKIEDIYSDPKAYNINAVLKAFVDTMEEQVTEIFGKTTGPNGEYLTKTELTSKLPYETVINPKTGTTDWKRDKHGRKVLKEDDDNLLILARNNVPLNLIMEEAVGTDEAKQRQWLRDNVPGFDKTKQTGDIKTGFRNNDDSGRGGVDPGSSIVGSGDNSLKSFDKIGFDKKIGFDSISFGYSSPTSIPFSTTQGGAPDKTGTFSGLRTNPSTGKKEMEFVVPKQFSPGEKEIKYIPYDEKTFQQVLNSLTPKKREELRKLKSDFETQYAKMGEYVLDEDKLNADVDEITKYYEQNKADVGSDKFNSGFSELINKLGLDKNAKSNKTFWWFNPNELTIGDQVVKVTDKENMKQVLYNFQKGKYKKAKGLSGKSEADELGLN